MDNQERSGDVILDLIRKMYPSHVPHSARVPVPVPPRFMEAPGNLNPRPDMNAAEPVPGPWPNR